MATPAERTTPPRRTPRVGGIKGFADWRENERLGRAGTLQFDAPPCSPVVGTVQLCYGPDVDAEEKEGFGFASGAPVLPPFGGYVGVQCLIHPDNDYDGEARAGLELAEGRYVEAQLWTWLAGGSGTAAATLGAAIAAADEHADDNYTGRPVLHLNRGDAVLARQSGHLRGGGEGGKLFTANGTPVIASGAYTAGTVVISGDLTVEQSPIVVKPGDDLTYNTRLVIAESIYALLVDCDYRAEFTVTP